TDDRVRVGRPLLRRFVAGETEHALDDPTAALRVRLDGRDHFSAPLGVGAFLRVVRRERDVVEWIVELVRDSRRERPEPGQALRAPQLLLGPAEGGRFALPEASFLDDLALNRAREHDRDRAE